MWKGSKLSEFTYSELVVYKQVRSWWGIRKGGFSYSDKVKSMALTVGQFSCYPDLREPFLHTKTAFHWKEKNVW